MTEWDLLIIYICCALGAVGSVFVMVLMAGYLLGAW